MSFKIALQCYSVRDEMAQDFVGTLKKIKEMGYEGVEFASIYGKSPEEVKKICEDIGLIPISAHISYADILNNPDILSDYALIGCKYAVIPYTMPDERPGAKNFEKFLQDLSVIGTKAKELGMKLCYHNHDFEFEKLNGEYGLDVIYNTVSKDLLYTEIDTCWATVSGVDTPNYIRKYKDRTEIVHLKDFTGTRNENMYALIGIDEDKKKGASGKFEFRPLGKGLQNFPEILEACKDVNADWLIIEQDAPSMGKTPLECAEISIDYLKTLL